MTQLDIRIERFPIAGTFVISRGSKTEAVVVVATLTSGNIRGRGEGVPYARYGESVNSVLAQIESVHHAIEEGEDHHGLQKRLPPGAARNALDCALWDLAAKQSGHRVHELLGLPAPQPVTTAFTLSAGTPAEMAAAAFKARSRPLLKIKLTGEDDDTRLAAVRAATPDATLIVDANEAWPESMLEPLLETCAKAGVALVEQPLPAGQDQALAKIQRIVPVCADESVHDRHGLEELRNRYDAINIKLDKTGGLTEALEVAKKGKELGFDLMVGCMVASSLAMAPALLLANQSAFVDLDGPLLLSKDRPEGLLYEGSTIHPARLELWG